MKTIQLSERELSIIFNALTPPYIVSETHTDEFNELRNKVFYALRDARNDEHVSEPYKLPDRWIPVSARLPENNGGYLVWDGKHYQFAGFFFGSFQCNQFISEAITHWMPPPAPPQQEQ